MRISGLVAQGALLAAASLAGAQPVPLGKGLPAEEENRRAPAEARGLDRKVVALYAQGRVAEAVPPARAALALRRRLYPPARYPDGHPRLAFSLNNLGELLRERGDLDGAEPLLREALAMCRMLYPPGPFPAGHPDLAASLTNLGALLRDRGEYARAEALLLEALALYQKGYPAGRFPRGHPNLARCLNNAGELRRARGDLAGAERLAREALAMQRQLYPAGRFPDGHPELAASLNNLGNLLRERGEPARAESSLREAVALYRKLYPGGHPGLAGSLDNLGVVLQAQGEDARAEPCFREALALYRRLYPARHHPHGHPDLAYSLTNVALALLDRGDRGGAEPLLREALAMRRGLYPPARYPAGHPELAQGLNHLGTALLRWGKPGQAGPLLREALAMNRRLYPPGSYPDGHPDLAAGLANVGSLVQARGEDAQAELFFGEALAAYDRLGKAFLAGASEAEALNHLAGLPPVLDGYLSVTRRLPGKEADAYAAVWRAKGLVARWLGRRRLAARAGGAGARALGRELAQVRRELAALLLARRPEHARRCRELAERKEALEKELARRLPGFARELGLAHGSPGDLLARLPEGAAFVDLVRYVRIEEDPARPGVAGETRTPCYAGFVLCRGRPARRVELGEAAPVDAALAAWRKALAGPGRTPAGGAGSLAAGPAHDLRRLAWEPLAGRLPPGTRVVWLAPDGALTGLPWVALPGRGGRGVLLEEVALAVVPHGHLLLKGLGSPPGGGEGLLLAVGGVDYDCRPPAGGRAAAEAPRAAARSPGRLHWPALPGTAREVRRVLGLAGKRPALVRRGAEASAARLLEDLPKARWAHLATHGFFADASFRSALRLSEKDYEKSRRGEKVGIAARSPLVLSGLVLAGANGRGQEGPPDGGILTAEAIAGLDLDGLELAVLSACDTGLGEVAGGEGVFGLQRAFHLAGCKDVVASLWQVDDEATAALMGLFYHKLWREKLPPVEALRQAQLTLYRHPERIPQLARARGPDFDRVASRLAGAPSGARAPARLWAGFVLSGAGR
jgi:tetratricopeptide (TPR) repeat protein